MSIMDLFPGEPRLAQKRLLEQVSDGWHEARHHVISMPVAAGKSHVAMTLARRAQLEGMSAIILTPYNMLIDQYIEDFPELQTVKARTKYKCNNSVKHSCEIMQMKNKVYCKSCPYLKAKDKTRRAWISTVNFQTYLSHKLKADVIIVDEAHKIIPLLQDRFHVKLWEGDYNFKPKNLNTREDISSWLDYAPYNVKTIRARKLVGDDEYHTRIWQTHRSNKLKWCIDFTPISVRNHPPLFWQYPRVKKVFLMSATIGGEEVSELGLDRFGNTNYYDVDSPIAPDRRRIIYHPVADMTYDKRVAEIPHLINFLLYMLNTNEAKGLIHASYDIARMLQRFDLKHDRLIFHTKENKSAMLAKFKRSKDKVLVGSGLEEGLDLADDKARWQVITRVPYPSLADPLVKERSKINPRGYTWETIKLLAQASGRVCRSPTDYGETYITDPQFERLLKKRDQFPKWFDEALFTTQP
jgi:Rad3-related DNA helicase